MCPQFPSTAVAFRINKMFFFCLNLDCAKFHQAHGVSYACVGSILGVCEPHGNVYKSVQCSKR